MSKNVSVQKGYKETKLGLIPEEWKVCTFGDVADQDIRWSIA